MISQPSGNAKSESPKSFLLNFDFLASIVCVATFFLWSFLLINKYNQFGYDDWDLAFFNQATYNLLHGSSFSSIFGINFFSNHSNFIAYLCLPIYAIFSHPLTLVHLKVLSVVVGGFLLYVTAKEKLNGRWGLFLMLAYFLYPANVYGILYEFDYESLAPAFLFGLYYCFDRNYWKRFLILAFITMSIKENMPLIVMAFGIVGILIKRKERIKWGIAPLLLGFISFYLLTSVIIPHFAHSVSHGYLGYYKGFGSSPTQIMANIMIHPWKIIPYFNLPENRSLILNLFLPGAFVALWHPITLILMVPIFLQHLLSAAPQEHTIHYQYGLSVAPFIFLAWLNGIIFLRKKCRTLTISMLGVVILFLNFYCFSLHLKGFQIRYGQDFGYVNYYRWKLLEKIPKDKPVMATLSFMAELSSRKEVYGFHKVYSDTYNSPTYTYQVPESVEYALIDFNSPWILDQFYFDPKVTTERIKNFYFQNSWSLVDSFEDHVLLSKVPGPKLLTVSDNGANMVSGSSKVVVEEKFSLKSFKVGAGNVKVGAVVPIEFQWQALTDIAEHYQILLTITAGKKVFHRSFHDIGYRIYPTYEWKKSELVTEKYNLIVPNLDPGKYDLNVSIINLNTKQMIEIKDKLDAAQGKKKKYFLVTLTVGR